MNCARIKRLVISLTHSEKNLLMQLAICEGRLSMTAMIRHLIIDAARARGLLMSSEQPISGLIEDEDKQLEEGEEK